MADEHTPNKTALVKQICILRQEAAQDGARGKKWLPVNREWLAGILNAAESHVYTLPEDPPAPDLIVARMIANKVEASRADSDDAAMPDYTGGHYDDTKLIVAIRKGLCDGMKSVGWSHG